MKICKVANYTAPAKNAQGAQRVLESLAKSFIKMGHEVKLLINQGSKTDIAEIVSTIPHDTDIVHYHGGFPNDYGHSDDAFRWVTTSHGGGADSPEMVAKIRKRVDNLIFVSRFCSDMYDSGCFVHSSVDVNEYLFEDRKGDYFLWMAGTDWGEQKGLFSSIALAKKMKVKLKIAGGGQSISIINQIKSQTDNKIEFLGFVNGNEKAELLRNAKALLMIGKIADACPLTSVEALACGTPIIARNTASHPEMIGDDAGFLCDTDIQICKAMININRIDRNKCRKRYLDNFTSEACAKKYINYYKHVINGKSLKDYK